MNYDLLTWVDMFAGAFACCFGMFLSGKILLERNIKEIKLARCFLLIPLTLFIIFYSLMFDNIVKMFCSLLELYMMFKFVYQERKGKIFVYSIALYIVLMLSEMVFALIISLVDYAFNASFGTIVARSIFGNIIIAFFACIITLIFRRKIMALIKRINKSNILIICLQAIITGFVIISSINYLYIDNFKFSYKSILNAIIIFGSAFLTFALLKEYLKNKEVVEKHQLLEEYLKTSAELIEKYSTTNHKYKNNLVAIKGYLNSDINEANKYIDHLLDNFQDRKYKWVSKINYIPIDTIRYFIYYKLSKSEELNLRICVNVSKDVKDIDKNILSLHELGNISEILGEYFDNANYASNESKEKELNFDLYIENKKLVFIFSNTYKDEVDLNSIIKNGYSTKGKGHGLGLYDVDKTISNMNILENKYEIIDKYFVATLMVDLSKIEE